MRFFFATLRFGAPLMLQNIRKNSQGTIAKVIVLLIVASFATFGMQSILIGSGNVDVAEVNGEGISASELQQAINIQKRRLLSTLGDEINPSMLEDQMLQGPAMEGLIQQRLYLDEAERNGVVVADEAVKSRIMSMPQFAENGQFSAALYQNVLSSNGYSPALFHKLLKEEQITGQLRFGIASTEFLTGVELERTAAISQETRNVRFLAINADSFREALNPDQEAIEAFYLANIEDFMTRESVDLEYIEVETSDFYPEIDEQILKTEYEARIANYGGGEERRVSHILLEVQGDDEQQTRERIAEIRNLAVAGESFASLAEQYSEDKSSSMSGGDLGFTGGDVFPEEMEETIQSLSLNAVSEPVLTDAGWHLLQVTEISEQAAPDFLQMRAELLADIQQQEARAKIVTTIETLRDIVFNAQDLSEPAGELELEVEQAENIYRQGNQAVFDNPSVISAAFGDDVLLEGHNSEVIEISDDHYVVLRAKAHRKPEPKAVELVSGQIVEELTAKAASAATERKALEILGKLRKGSTIQKEALANGYKWQVELAVLRQSNALAPLFMDKVFALQNPAQNSSLFDYVRLASGDIVVFELDRVTRGNVEGMIAQQAGQLKQQINRELSRAVDENYQQALRDRAEIELL